MASTSASTPIGRLTKNTARQPCSSPKIAISAPPRTGPIAVEVATTVPKKPNALARSWPWKSVWMSPLTCGVTSPPAKPWSSRRATSAGAEGASPQPALAAVKSATPTMNIHRRPRASPMRPAGTSRSPKVSA